MKQQASVDSGFAAMIAVFVGSVSSVFRSRGVVPVIGVSKTLGRAQAAKAWRRTSRNQDGASPRRALRTRKTVTATRRPPMSRMPVSEAAQTVAAALVDIVEQFQGWHRKKRKGVGDQCIDGRGAHRHASTWLSDGLRSQTLTEPVRIRKRRSPPSGQLQDGSDRLKLKFPFPKHCAEHLP